MAKDKKTYTEKLKDPRWKVRKQAYIINYFGEDYQVRCEGCGAEDDLQLHHKRYIYNKEPWEYDDKDLAMLCSYCHEIYHKNKSMMIGFLTNHRLFYTYEFSEIFSILKLMCGIDTNNYGKIKESIIDLHKNRY